MVRSDTPCSSVKPPLEARFRSTAACCRTAHLASVGCKFPAEAGNVAQAQVVDEPMATDWQAEQRLLADAGIVFGPGLTEAELRHAEVSIEAGLPPDLRQFLSQGLPIGEKFPDWRHPQSAGVRAQLDWPFEGIAFDIRNNSFWFSEWGARPDDDAEAIAVARRHVSEAPRLIPVFAHRYLPADPAASGNPVFSVYQTDIICYGVDLQDYLRAEFIPSALDRTSRHEPREVRLWTNLAG
jgi:hypothetical protein